MVPQVAVAVAEAVLVVTRGRDGEGALMKTTKSHLSPVSVSKESPALAQTSTLQIKLDGITEAFDILRNAERAAPWLKD